MYLNIIFKYKKGLIDNYTVTNKRFIISIIKLIKIKKGLIVI